MFQIIGAMAEFERSLVQERVKAGLRNARAKGKKFGGPRAHVDADRVAELAATSSLVVPDMPKPHSEQGNGPAIGCRVHRKAKRNITGPG